MRLCFLAIFLLLFLVHITDNVKPTGRSLKERRVGGYGGTSRPRQANVVMHRLKVKKKSNMFKRPGKSSFNLKSMKKLLTRKLHPTGDPSKDSRNLMAFLKSICDKEEGHGDTMLMKGMKKLLRKDKSLHDCCSEMERYKQPTLQQFQRTCMGEVEHSVETIEKNNPRVAKMMRKAEKEAREGRRKRSSDTWDNNGFYLRRLKRAILGKVKDGAKKIANRMNLGHRGKRGVGQGIAAGVVIAVGLWLGYLALLSFFCIIIPPHIIAMLFTFVFGMGSWFCLKAAEAIINGSMEDEYDEDYMDSGEGNYGGYGGYEELRGGQYDYDEEQGYGDGYGGGYGGGHRPNMQYSARHNYNVQY